jgi:hypothetical protein
VILRADQALGGSQDRAQQPRLSVCGIITKLKRAFRKIKLTTGILEKSLAKTTFSSDIHRS